ncbi:MAG: hypothetical protein AMS26_10785 [Bacteroides sp. SM23_62]|nr:MAG: hypothetical protein AMS26_10785 [Bacteroides sp. SM23_62]
MKIYSESGYLIVMDPAYLKVADYNQIKKIDFLKTPKDAAQKLERMLFPDSFGGLIGLIKLSDGAGEYEVDLDQVNFWDVDTKGKKIIFGVDLGSFIIFDIKYIHPLIQHFDPVRFENEDEAGYLHEIQKKSSNRNDILIYSSSPLPFAEGWHEINLTAFKKIN